MKALNIAVAGCGQRVLRPRCCSVAVDTRFSVKRFNALRLVRSGLIIQPTGLVVPRAMGLDQAVILAGARITA